MVEMLLSLYIQYVVEPQFSVESVWVDHLALVQNCWWKTTNRLQHPKQGHLESNQHFFFCVPSMWYLDHCFSSVVGSRLVWVHWMLGFKGKGLCFAFAARDKLWSVLDVLLETSARGRSTLGMRVCTTLRRSEGFVVYISQCNDF